MSDKNRVVCKKTEDNKPTGEALFSGDLKGASEFRDAHPEKDTLGVFEASELEPPAEEATGDAANETADDSDDKGDGNKDGEGNADEGNADDAEGDDEDEDGA